jgi:phospholipase C
MGPKPRSRSARNVPRRFAALFGIGAIATSGCAAGSLAGPPGVAPLTAPLAEAKNLPRIRHIVFIVQENRSFDDFFATFPGADGATSGLMKTAGGDVTVRLKKEPLDSDSLGHQHSSFEKEYDGGRMDGFNLVKRVPQKGIVERAGTYPYRYVDPKEIQPYWTIARQWVLADHMFPTQSSSSFTAHQDLIAGGTPVGGGKNVIDFPTPSSWGCDAPLGTVTSLITSTGKYLRAQGPYPCFAYRTLRDLMDAKDVSWLYFTNPTNNSVWNAFDAIQAVREGSEWTTHIVRPESDFFAYVTSGELPQVSWVIPDEINSDHPGNQHDTGPSWVASIINAIGQSSYWPSTAIVVVWDDWGGEYDQVPPPQLDGQGLGMRVPMLLVSPYARVTSPSQPGYISHTQYEFGSLVRFVEDNWNLGRLGTTDGRANSILDSFDFTQAPRPFTIIPSKYSKAFFERQKPSGLPVDSD